MKNLGSNNLSRQKQIERLSKIEFDCLIIGGGATGVGTALDASLRGLNVALVERNDFSAGTSSRSTKLIHGGIRYLPKLHFKLIKEALHERTNLLNNAPHLVKPLRFIIPVQSIIEEYYLRFGLFIYDLLAGKSGLPKHAVMSKDSVLEELSSISVQSLQSGVSYYDAQFNDSRLNIAIARAAQNEGVCICNRVQLEQFEKTKNQITTAIVRDLETDQLIRVKAKTFVNTTGVFADKIRILDDPNSKSVLAPSQGIHIIVSKSKIHCKSAMVIPKTSDNRILFIIPWEEYVLIGTTDTVIQKISEEPLPLKEEIIYLLKTVNEYLDIKLVQKDILSVFAGLRPLVNSASQLDTSDISREEIILVSKSGLITMVGGKWSTYRKMAEVLTDKIISHAGFKQIQNCTTIKYSLPGKDGYTETMYLTIQNNYHTDYATAKRLKNNYGGEVFEVLGNSPIELVQNIGYYKEEVIHFIQKEFALSLTDVLSRRFRILPFDLNLAIVMIEPVLKVMSKELNWTEDKTIIEKNQTMDLIHSLKIAIDYE